MNLIIKNYRPVPIEFIIVIIGTLISYYFSFNKKFKINIVGKFPTGFKAPIIPPFELYGDLISDAVSISIVTFFTNISMCKLFSKKYNYEIQPNQVNVKFLKDYDSSIQQKFL